MLIYRVVIPLILLHSWLLVPSYSSGQNMTRGDFVKRLSKVDQQMQSRQVRKLLGDPDAVAELESLAVDSLETHWRYGVVSRNGIGTLGTVVFHKDAVKVVFGGKGMPYLGLGEKKTREFLDLFSKLPSLDDLPEFNVRQLIKAANQVAKLKKSQVIGLSNEYLRIDTKRIEYEGLSLLLNLLVDNKSTEVRRPLIFTDDEGYSFKIATAFAQQKFYPFLFVDQLPIALTTRGSGQWRDKFELVEFVRFVRLKDSMLKSGIFPSKLEETVESINLIATKVYGYDRKRLFSNAGSQISNLISFKSKAEKEYYRSAWTISNSSEKWKKLTQLVENKRLVWNENLALFVFERRILSKKKRSLGFDK